MTLSRSVSIYTCASFIQASIPFFLLPILTTWLDPAEYGLLSLIQTVVMLLLPFVLAGADSAVSVEYFRKGESEAPSLIRSIFLIPVFSFLLLSLVFLPGGSWLAGMLHLPWGWVLFVPLFALLQGFCQLFAVVFRIRQCPVAFSVFNISQTLCNFSLSILFVVGFKLGWQGRLLGIFSSYFLFVIVGLILFSRRGYFAGPVKRSYITGSLVFGLPLIVHSMGGSVMGLADRLFIDKMVDREALGFYTVGLQVAAIMSIVVNSFNHAWAPLLYQKLSGIQEEDKVGLVKQVYLIQGLFLAAAFVLCLASPLIFRLMIHKNFHEGLSYVTWLVLAAMLKGFYYTVVNFIFFAKRSYVISSVTVSVSVVNVMLNWFLIGRFGALGCAYAAVISALVFFGVTWAVSARVYPLPWLFFLRRNTPSKKAI